MHEFIVVDTFQLAGRGLVVTGSVATPLAAGVAHRAETVTPGGRVLRRSAFREFLLRSASPVDEREAFLLPGTTKDEVPTGSRVRLFPHVAG
jgi:hypothetical protein